MKEESTDGEGGRGLSIVEALSSKWGYYLEGGGKVVWAELLVRNQQTAVPPANPLSDMQLLARVKQALQAVDHPGREFGT